jgi:hypothetical protein
VLRELQDAGGHADQVLPATDAAKVLLQGPAQSVRLRQVRPEAAG